MYCFWNCQAFLNAEKQQRLAQAQEAAALEEALQLLKSFETVNCDRNGILLHSGNFFFCCYKSWVIPIPFQKKGRLLKHFGLFPIQKKHTSKMGGWGKHWSPRRALGRGSCLNLAATMASTAFGGLHSCRWGVKNKNSSHFPGLNPWKSWCLTKKHRFRSDLLWFLFGVSCVRRSGKHDKIDILDIGKVGYML